MRLDEWMSLNNCTSTQLAYRMGVSSGTVSRWRQGHEPTASLLRKLSRLTARAVTGDDFPIKRGMTRLALSATAADWLGADSAAVD